MLQDQNNSEFQIPNSNQEISSQPEQASAINKDELNAIYQNLGSICESLVSNPNKNERISEVSERLYLIARELDEARSIEIDMSIDKAA